MQTLQHSMFLSFCVQAMDDGGDAQKAAVAILRHVSEFSPALVREACLEAAANSGDEEVSL